MNCSRHSIWFLVALMLIGCWRTRLTEPKEAILYYDEQGQSINADVVMRAPEYMTTLRRLRAERGVVGEEEYRIKPNLRLRIEVVGVQDLDRTIDVSPNGKIGMPYVGEVLAEGMTMTELREELERLYAKYYERPQVIVNSVSTTLTASEIGGLPQAGVVSVFSVTGRLDTRPFGQYRAGGTVNLRGDERVIEILAKTFALTGESEWRQIAVIREAVEEGLTGVIIVDASRFFTLGETGQNIPIKDGDVIFVPIERNTWVEELAANVRVLGGFASTAVEIANFVSIVEDL